MSSCVWLRQHPAGGFEQTGGAVAPDAAPDAAVPAAHSLRLARAVIKMLAEDAADEVRLLPPANPSDAADGAAALGDDELRLACEVVSGKVFGVSLPALVERRRKLAGAAQATVPEVLPELFALVEKKGGHRLEGIFRLSAAKEKTDELVSVIDQAGDDPSTAAVLESCGPSVVATALKQWLGALPQPLFPFAVYDEAIAAHSDADAARAICLRLPPAHQCLLADLMACEPQRLSLAPFNPLLA